MIGDRHAIARAYLGLALGAAVLVMVLLELSTREVGRAKLAARDDRRELYAQLELLEERALEWQRHAHAFAGANVQLVDQLEQLAALVADEYAQRRALEREREYWQPDPDSDRARELPV